MKKKGRSTALLPSDKAASAEAITETLRKAASPKLVEAALLLTLCDLEKGRYDSATKTLHAIKDIAGYENRAAAYLTIIKYKKKQAPLDIAVLEKATTDDEPGDSFLDGFAANYFFEAGRTASAVRCITRMLDNSRDRLDYLTARNLAIKSEAHGLPALTLEITRAIAETTDHIDPQIQLSRAKCLPSFFPARPPSFSELPIRPAPPSCEAVIVDVIIPVYRDIAITLHCIHSVLASKNAIGHEVIVIDDRSPDPELSAELRRLSEAGLITLLENQNNLGFVRSVNRGMSLHPDRDVLLLNSDTEVNGDWIDRLRSAAYRQDWTGTATPLSNNATICSYPTIGENNMSLEVSSAELDQLAKDVNPNETIPVPTAVGFCMYIRRDCLTETGLFDAEAFGQGYGEENDFCMRATRLGWTHVLAANTYVRHFGSISFGASRKERVENATRVLLARHPDYLARVGEHLNKDPARLVRTSLDLSRITRHQKDRPAMLFVTHALGGGTERHIKEMISLSEQAGFACFTLRPNYPHDGKLYIALNGVEFTPNLPMFDGTIRVGIEALTDFLLTLKIQHIHVHNLIGFPLAIIRELPSVAQRMGCLYDYTLHDYSALCPRFTLIDSSGKFCDVADENTCVKCLSKEREQASTIFSWRAEFSALLQGARYVFAPSRDVGGRVSRHIHGLSIKYRPHAYATPLAGAAQNTRRDLTSIAIIGGIHRAKGSAVVVACAKAALRNKLPLRFIVIGTIDVATNELPQNVLVTGRYREEDVDGLIAYHRCASAFFPAIWPETYSYTLSVALRNRLFPICFDIGAIAERIRAASFGIILPRSLISSPDEINQQLMRVSEEPSSPALNELSVNYDFESYYEIPRAIPKAGKKPPGLDISTINLQLGALQKDIPKESREISQIEVEVGTLLPRTHWQLRDEDITLCEQQIKGVKHLHAVVVGEAGKERTIDTLTNQLLRIPFTLVSDDPAEIVAAVQKIQEKWILLLSSGTELLPHATLLTASKVAATPSAMIAYSDEIQRTANTRAQKNLVFKPKFDLHLSITRPYVNELFAIRRTAAIQTESLTGTNVDEIRMQLLIEIASRYGDDSVLHIPHLLCISRPRNDISYASVSAALLSSRIPIAAVPGNLPGAFSVRHLAPTSPKVTVVIPTRDHVADLQRCLESIFSKNSYPNCEYLIIDNNSSEPSATLFLEGLKKIAPDQIRVESYAESFNFAAMLNMASEKATGEYLLFLNNDTAALHPDWLERMMDYGLIPDVGIVGCRLAFPNGTLQHAGITLGMSDAVAFPWQGLPLDTAGHLDRLQVAHQVAAVTGACLLIRNSVFKSVGGMDMAALPIAFGDVDLCLKVRNKGYRVIWTPHATLMHEAGKTIKDALLDGDTAQREAIRFEHEKMIFSERWRASLCDDPQSNPNFSLRFSDFRIEQNPTLLPDPLSHLGLSQILALPADLDGSGHYRVITPASNAHRSGMLRARIAHGYPSSLDMDRMGIRTLVTQRQVDDQHLAVLTHLRKTIKPTVVMDFDDLLTHVPETSYHKPLIWKDIGRRLQDACRLSDRITVSTEPLANHMRRYHSNVMVVKNFIDSKTWQTEPSVKRDTSRRKRVGWVGGLSHTGDLLLLKKVVCALAAEVDWIFMGLCPDELRPFAAEFHPGVPFGHYPRRMASLDLDIGLAPLEINAFNECKSNLRLLEYGALGIPVIASDITPYQCGLPVTLLANRADLWTKTIREKLSDREALQNEGERLRTAVFNEYTQQQHIDQWMSAWTSH